MCFPRRGDVGFGRTLRQMLSRDVQQQIRIRTDTVPDRALTGANGTIHIAWHVEHVGDELHMNMRPPVAVRRCAAHARKLSAFRDFLADREACERITREMPVEREELNRIGAAGAMAQHNHRAVVVIAVGVLKAMHHAVQWRVQR